jgi:hypothetical protein
MGKKLISLSMLLFFVTATAQEIKKESMFEGVLNDQPIQIYIQSFENECTGATYYQSIVRFLDHEISEKKWRKFQIFANKNNGYILIDDAWNSGRFSNYIFIDQDKSNLKGFIKNEEFGEKSIQLERNIEIKDFSEYRTQMKKFDDINDC